MFTDSIISFLKADGGFRPAFPSAELKAKLAALQSALAALVVSGVGTDGNRDAINAAHKCAHELSSSALEELPSLVPFWQRRSARRLEARYRDFVLHTRKVFNGRNAQLSSRVPRLADRAAHLLDDLNEFSSRIARNWALPGRFLFWGAALAALLIGAATWFLHWHTGLSSISPISLFPARARISSASDTLPTAPEDEDSFFFEFSKYYFRRSPNDFAATYLEFPTKQTLADDSSTPARIAPTEARTKTRIKLMAENLASTGRHFVSDVATTVEMIEETPFPWHRMYVTPHLTLRSYVGEPRSIAGFSANVSEIRFEDDGIGPAVNVKWVAHSQSGLPLADGMTPLVYGDYSFMFPNIGDSIGIVRLASESRRVKLGPRDIGHRSKSRNGPVRSAQGTVLEHVLFYQLAAAPAQPDLSKEFEHDGKWYETIQTLERLDDLTMVAHDEPYTICVAYEGLDGSVFTTQLLDDLPPGDVYYGRKRTILEHDPRKERYSFSETTTHNAEAWAHLSRLAEMFVPPAEQPEGTSLIVRSAELDVSSIGRGEQATCIVPVDRFLNPHARIGLYLTLNGVRNGRYAVTFSANEEVIDRREIITMAPDRLRFPRSWIDQMADIERLKQSFKSK